MAKNWLWSYNVQKKVKYGAFSMSIKELTNKVRSASPKRSHAARVKMLKKAQIIDKNGYYSERYFSEETVEKDKEAGKAITA
ncbi:hypothetical protein [Vibrio sp. TRT 2004]|uniref:hypothetical protein n=1 Tax=Vibrio sp. TRT 2004 TaxID=3418506 RepID=UPI003CF892E1